MKRNITTKLLMALLSLSLLTSSCSSYNQINGVATGASLGGIFGSSVGGLMGGPRGADKGTIAGMIIGGAIGAAATSSKQKTRRPSHNDSQNQSDPTFHGYSRSNDNDDVYSSSSSNNSNGVEYGTYKTSGYDVPYADTADLQALEVTNLRFLDENNNRRIDTDEKAYLVFDIYNRGEKALYNVAPNITCNSKRVVISAATSVDCVQPGQGIRYKAAVVAVRKLSSSTPITFTISFGQGKQQVVAKTFSL